MIYLVAADVVIILHLLFVLFVTFGGLLVFKWRWVIWLHVPAAAWGALIEFQGWVCPLTYLENWFRGRAGQAGYAGDFIQQYIVPIVYPHELSRDLQMFLGGMVVIINLVIYGWLLSRKKSGGIRSD